jgi:hypothetical protein
MQPQREEYYLLVNGDTAGPYTLAELHQMWMEDKITLDTLFVRPGMRKCQPINLILGMVINYHAAQPAEAAPPAAEEEDHPLAPFKGILRWGLMGACLLVFIWLIGPWRGDSESQLQIMRGVVTVKPADLGVYNEREFEWQEVFVYLNGQPPVGYKRKLGNLAPGTGKDITLLEFTDVSGAAFEPWRMSITEVWIGNEKLGYRTFRVRPLPLQ